MISVVMPAYNSEEFIGPAIDSILAQTYKDFEFIIIDDGSTDRTLEIIEDYAQRDSRIIVVKGTHEGVSAALNLGIETATRPWVAIMHADDVAVPTRLERQLEAAQQDPEVVIWGTDGYHVNSKGERLSVFRVGPRNKEEYWHLRNNAEIVQVIHPTAMLNREVLVKVGGYDPEFRAWEDIELFDRMLEHGRLQTISEPLLHYRVHGSSISMTKHLTRGIAIYFIIERQRARLEGRPVPTYEEYEKIYASMPWIKRARITRDEMASIYYRRAGMAYGERSYLSVAWFLLIAAIINPAYTLPRAWRQVLSPKARHGVQLTLPEVKPHSQV
jgi:glycosyltransferase involved in cell wall biosynthesis